MEDLDDQLAPEPGLRGAGRRKERKERLRFKTRARESSLANKGGISHLWVGAGGARREGPRGLCQPPRGHTFLLGDVLIPLVT